MVLDKETQELISDRFEPWELVDFLQLKMDDILFMFREEVEENLDDILEFIQVGTRRDRGE